MSDIRFNRWLHSSGTGGVHQIDGGHIGIGTDNPTGPAHTLNSCVVNAGIVTANQIHGSFHGDGSNLSGVSAFVTGMIMMYTGSTAPSGWALCDGQNGTPDLRDRFIVSNGSTYSIDDTGGSADAIVVSHTHGITDPGHTHTYSRAQDEANGYAEVGTAQERLTLNVSYANQTTGSNTTGISIDSQGSSGTDANLPPYYALAFIMKL